MPNRLVGLFDFLERLYADEHVIGHIVGRYLAVRISSLHAIGSHRVVRHEQQSACWTVVGKATGEKRGRVHVHRHVHDHLRVLYPFVKKKKKRTKKKKGGQREKSFYKISIDSVYSELSIFWAFIRSSTTVNCFSNSSLKI